MSMFKTRNKKIYVGDSRVTLDAKHQQIIHDYHKESNFLERKQQELDKCQREYDELKNNSFANDIPQIDLWTKLYEKEREIQKRESELKKISHQENTQDYFLKTGDLLCQYYQHLDFVAHGEDDPQTQETVTTNRSTKKYRTNNVKPKGKRNFSWMENTTTRTSNILSFFQQSSSSSVAADDAIFSDDSDQEDTSLPESPDHSVEPHEAPKDELYPEPSLNPGSDFDRAAALQQFLSETDPNYTPPKPPTWMIDFCPQCLALEKVRRELVLQMSDGMMICEYCGHMEQVVVDSEKPSYKEPPPEATYFAYKRINHFNEWLNQIQAKESTEIPPEVYQYILEEIRKERIKDLGTLTPDKIRGYLKKLRLNKYYEHIPHIINKLNGLPPPILTREVEEKLRVMFREIQAPFLEVCPKDRKNFLSYSYVLHKCVELLGLEEYKSIFPLLKSREKLARTDALWKAICEKLGWEFKKSI